MTVTRPVFADGVVLAADDLSVLESVSRDRDARHGRNLHTPGIGSGLEFVEEQQTTGGTAFVDLTLTSGYALDGTGRELVLAAGLRLSPDRFLDQNLNPTMEPGQPFTVWHPVFLRGLDTAVTATTAALGCQSRDGSGRVAEDVEVEFGRPGDAAAAQPTPAADSGPGDGAWRVLIGFVRYHPAIQRFVASGVTADGVTVTTAGARAGLVAGRTGQVEIRGRAAADSGVPALVLDTAPGPSLVFGTHTGSGTVAPLLAVDASGNLTIQGAVTSKGTAGAVRMVGGAASDGTVLPLPAGIDQATVDSGGIELVVQVSPRLPTPGSGPANTIFVPAECRVDADRRVHCWGNWLNSNLATLTAAAISCDYLVLAASPGGP